MSIISPEYIVIQRLEKKIEELEKKIDKLLEPKQGEGYFTGKSYVIGKP